MTLVKILRSNVARGVIVKIHGRCDLACDYCYVYQHADQSWRDKPKGMSKRVIDKLATRIAEYMREHELPDMSVILHGGEPLLAGKEKIDYLITTFRKALPRDRTLHFVIQTNGTQLDTEWLELFLRHNVKVGVSLDGDSAGNRHRLFANGRSSHDLVKSNLELFQQERFRGLLGIILGVVDLHNDPITTYRYLRQFAQPSGAQIDLLLPLGNWNNLPLGSFPLTGRASYGPWLIAVFDHWLRDKSQVSIRLFEQIMYLSASALLKQSSPLPNIEAIGPWTVGDIVVETDGTYELLDGYKTTAPGQARLGLNVFEHTLTRALVDMLRTTEARGIATLGPECQQCPVVNICGGGLYLNRFKDGSYLNRSIYCQDLWMLISYITGAMVLLDKTLVT